MASITGRGVKYCPAPRDDSWADRDKQFFVDRALHVHRQRQPVHPVEQVDDELLEQCGVVDLAARPLEDRAEHPRLGGQPFQALAVLVLQRSAVQLQQRLPAELRRHERRTLVRRLGQLVLQLHTRRPLGRSHDLRSEGLTASDLDSLAAFPLEDRSLRQPQRPQQRDLRPAVRGLAAHRASPQVGDGRAPVRVRGVEVGQLPFCGLLDLAADPAQLVGQPRAVAGDVLQHHLEDQAGHRVQVAGEGLAAQPQGLQRDRAAARERVHHQGRLRAVRRPHQRPGRIEPDTVCRKVPVGEVGDELEQDPPQALIRLDGLSPPIRPPVHPQEDPPRLPLERLRAMRVARVRQQQRHQHRPRGRQRPPRPP